MTTMFEIGKRYKHLSSATIPSGVTMTNDDLSFTCRGLAFGECMSTDALYEGEALTDGEGWCVAAHSDLLNGLVVEVKK